MKSGNPHEEDVKIETLLSIGCNARAKIHNL
jgi:hypothetical protein